MESNPPLFSMYVGLLYKLCGPKDVFYKVADLLIGHSACSRMDHWKGNYAGRAVVRQPDKLAMVLTIRSGSRVHGLLSLGKLFRRF